jgi:tRNA(fMet)-specific endonuclease VapC
MWRSTRTCVSAITKSELLYGVEVSPRRAHDAAAVDQFLRYIEILDYPSAAAEEYALLRGELKRQGKLIGPNDLLLAAHARHLGLTLVTNNVHEFSRVSGLKLENWAEET